ncbi:hypothetical protein CEXT_803361 [Caerostris extrusa]|uniref:Uncharacterized protein n=1 Tax=Caerostris extrusa TaxID=172846 RepID=A0AAV4QTX5_CAEEX|nr:hypothetical protein CEXT_803361 [Caerostris extrusa]
MGLDQNKFVFLIPSTANGLQISALQILRSPSMKFTTLGCRLHALEEIEKFVMIDCFLPSPKAATFTGDLLHRNESQDSLETVFVFNGSMR